MIAWLLKRWPWAGAVLLGLVIAIKVWWDRWRDGVALERETARADRAAAERDAAVADAATERMRATVTADQAVAELAADVAAERIEDVPITDDAAADRARIYDGLLSPADDDHRP